MSNDLLPFKFRGDVNKPLLIFIAGFPDDVESGWGEEFLQSIEQDYQLLCVCFPGFESPKKEAELNSFADIVETLHRTILFCDRSNSGKKITIVGHDWGCFIALLYQNKHGCHVESLILFDVGVGFPLEPHSWTQFGFIALYQGLFCLAYVISRHLSHSLGNRVFKFCFLPQLYHSLGPTPCEIMPRPTRDIDVKFCYPYFNFWYSYLFDASKCTNPIFPSCPVFFLYGRKKNAMFHSKLFEQRLRSTPGCAVRAMDCGHWITIAEPVASASLLKEFIRNEF